MKLKLQSLYHQQYSINMAIKRQLCLSTQHKTATAFPSFCRISLFYKSLGGWFKRNVGSTVLKSCCLPDTRIVFAFDSLRSCAVPALMIETPVISMSGTRQLVQFIKHFVFFACNPLLPLF